MAGLQIIELELPGAFLIDAFQHVDERGEFFKTLHAEKFREYGLKFELREEFYSVSQRGTLRGMHFQTPPADHQKLVTCITGSVIDVLVDLRRDGGHFGKFLSLDLSAAKRQMVWIPSGVAHGFLSLEDGTCVAYKTDREYAPANDSGIRWDSFGMAWPMSEGELKISPRDLQHPPLSEFMSPF